MWYIKSKNKDYSLTVSVQNFLYAIFPKEQPANAEMNTPSDNTIKYIVFLCNKYEVIWKNYDVPSIPSRNPPQQLNSYLKNL